MNKIYPLTDWLLNRLLPLTLPSEWRKHGKLRLILAIPIMRLYPKGSLMREIHLQGAKRMLIWKLTPMEEVR